MHIKLFGGVPVCEPRLQAPQKEPRNGKTVVDHDRPRSGARSTVHPYITVDACYFFHRTVIASCARWTRHPVAIFIVSSWAVNACSGASCIVCPDHTQDARVFFRRAEAAGRTIRT